MCGIFGLIRSTTDPESHWASAAFVELGRQAVERGRDAAGVAFTSPGATAGVTSPTHKAMHARDVTIDGVRIIKDAGSFDDLWDEERHLPLLAASRVALGHTRWATQGARAALVNASPLLVGSLVGTHNGDVAMASVPDHGRPLPALRGGTDTERLYQSLDMVRRDRRKVADTLTRIEGRAALAWLDRDRPDRVYLARAALSPLAIASDARGNLFWASNPEWFRRVDALFDGQVGFTDIVQVAEGTLLTVQVDREVPLVADMRRFRPRCRPSDARLSDLVAWRGFTAADVAVDKGQAHHDVAPARVEAFPGPWRGSKSSKVARAGALPRQDKPLPHRSALSGSLASALAAEEPEAWDNEAWDEKAEGVAIAEEVEEAVLAWIDEGSPTAVLNAVAQAHTAAQIETLRRRYRLSGPEAFEQFRVELADWDLDGVEAPSRAEF